MVKKEKNYLKEIDKLLKDNYNDNLDFLEGNIIEVSGDNDLFGDFHKIIESVLDDKNIFKLSYTDKHSIFQDCLLGTIANYQNIDKIKPRYSFLKEFRKNYHVARSSLDSRRAESVTMIASSFMQYKSYIDLYQNTRMQQSNEGEKSSSIKDALKG